MKKMKWSKLKEHEVFPWSSVDVLHILSRDKEQNYRNVKKLHSVHVERNKNQSCFVKIKLGILLAKK